MKPNPVLELCLFNLGEKLFGVKVSQVNEIIQMQDISPVPATPSYFVGIINRKGNILPVVTLNAYLNLPEKVVEKTDGLIIVKDKDVLVSLVVNSVNGVVSVKKSSVQPAIEYQKEKIVFGVVEHNHRPVYILSVEDLIEKMKEQIILE